MRPRQRLQGFNESTTLPTLSWSCDETVHTVSNSLLATHVAIGVVYYCTKSLTGATTVLFQQCFVWWRSQHRAKCADQHADSSTHFRRRVTTHMRLGLLHKHDDRWRGLRQNTQVLRHRDAIGKRGPSLARPTLRLHTDDCGRSGFRSTCEFGWLENLRLGVRFGSTASSGFTSEEERSNPWGSSHTSNMSAISQQHLITSQHRST